METHPPQEATRRHMGPSQRTGSAVSGARQKERGQATTGRAGARCPFVSFLREKT